MPLLALILALAAFAFGASLASAAEPRHTLTIKTSLGPLESEVEGDEETESRPLIAEGKAPRGARLVAHFYRGSRRIGTTRPKMRSGRRYKTDHDISRTGTYRVKVTAITRSGARIKVTARLKYAPKAEAPSAPDDPPS